MTGGMSRGWAGPGWRPRGGGALAAQARHDRTAIALTHGAPTGPCCPPVSGVLVPFYRCRQDLAHGRALAYPSSAAEPSASIVNYSTGQAVTNPGLVNPAAGNAFTLADQSSGTVNCLAGISGYFQ